jgi:hypothetical protein
MDQVRGVWTSQDQRPEERTKASKSAMVVMDRLSQNRNRKELWSGSGGGDVQSDGLEQVSSRSALNWGWGGGGCVRKPGPETRGAHHGQ